jgi:TolB protein
MIKKYFTFLLIGISIVFSSGVRAELKLEIDAGRVDPLPIAVMDFYSGKSNLDAIGAKITGVIQNNLKNSGLFRPIDRKAFIRQKEPLGDLPHFNDWQAINAQAMVHGELLPHEENGKFQVKFYLWDVYAREMLEGQLLVTEKDNWRRIAHIISDYIYKRLTGETGYFDTRIVYVAESGPRVNKTKRLAIMDQDGANHKYLTDGKDLVITPRFSPTMQQIVYMSYYKKIPRVYIFDIETGKHEVLGDFPGMTYAPRFSPDGKKVVLSMAIDGNSEIYEMDLRTRNKRRLTRNSAIDTSPSYSPDGKHIVFNSDRGGSQQLYIMDSDGSNVKRISFGDGRYATPVWSPRGDYIAFTKMKGGEYSIGVMFPDGTGKRLLVKAWAVEAPTWSPNGRVLMYWKQTPLSGGKDKNRIYAVDITGYNTRLIKTPGNASDPAWSPLLP